MADQPVPGADSNLRRFFGRLGAVARIGSVSRSEQAPAIDPARGTDPRWVEFPRPDPATIPIADITQFRGIVYGADAWHAPATSVAGEVQPPTASTESFTPADRIVGTLRHLRGMYGL